MSEIPQAIKKNLTVLSQTLYTDASPHKVIYVINTMLTISGNYFSNDIFQLVKHNYISEYNCFLFLITKQTQNNFKINPQDFKTFLLKNFKKLIEIINGGLKEKDLVNDKKIHDQQETEELEFYKMFITDFSKYLIESFGIEFTIIFFYKEIESFQELNSFVKNFNPGNYKTDPFHENYNFGESFVWYLINFKLMGTFLCQKFQLNFNPSHSIHNDNELLKNLALSTNNKNQILISFTELDFEFNRDCGSYLGFLNGKNIELKNYNCFISTHEKKQSYPHSKSYLFIHLFFNKINHEIAFKSLNYYKSNLDFNIFFHTRDEFLLNQNRQDHNYPIIYQAIFGNRMNFKIIVSDILTNKLNKEIELNEKWIEKFTEGFPKNYKRIKDLISSKNFLKIKLTKNKKLSKNLDSNYVYYDIN